MIAGKETNLAEGEECGDYAALVGQSGGLMMACKEAARQHPKEYHVAANKINLCLFSGRAGEELDFRMPTLVKKWGLPFLSAKPAKNDLQTGDQNPNLGDRLSDCLGGPVEIQDQSGP